MRWHTVHALALKDLRVFASDRRSLVMSFVAPIAIASFFGFLFADRGDAQAVRVPVAVVDQDGSAVSRAIAAGLAKDPALAVAAESLEHARAKVRSGKLAAAVVLPAGFGEGAGSAFFTGEGRPVLGLLHDPSKGTERAMVRGLVTQHVMEAVSAEMFAGEQGRRFTQETLATLDTGTGLPERDRASLRQLLEGVAAWSSREGATAQPGQAARGLSVPYDTREEAVTARAGTSYNSYAHSFAGMGVQFLLFACIDLAIALLVERQQGLWKRLRAAPVSRGEVLAARGMSAAAISLLVLAVTFAFGMAVFGIRIEGSFAGFLAVCVATALMASAFGLLIATVGGSPGGTRGVAILAVLLMVMLGGAWVPSFVFPAWMQTVTVVVPAKWAVDGFDAATWRGASLAAILPAVGALLGFAALFAAVAVARFRWEAE